MRKHEQYRQDAIQYIKQHKGVDFLAKFEAGKISLPCEVLQKRWEEILQETWRIGSPDKRDLALTILDTHRLLAPYAKHKRIPRNIVQLTLTLQTYIYAHAESGAKPFESILVHLCEFAYGVPDGKFLPTKKELEKYFENYTK